MSDGKNSSGGIPISNVLGSAAAGIVARCTTHPLDTIKSKLQADTNRIYYKGGPFDAIFCRNVMIYFDRPTREKLVNRLAGVLRPGGILAVGSAETLSGIDSPLEPLAASVYRR